MVLLGYRAVFDEKGGFGGGSYRHRYKKVLFNSYKKNHIPLFAGA